MFSVSTLASTYKTWGATLSSRRNPVYLEKGNYNDNSKSVKARVTYMGGDYNRMYFYLTTPHGEGESVMGTINVGYVSVKNAPGMNSGTTVELRGGNDKWSIVRVDAAGNVIFP